MVTVEIAVRPGETDTARSLWVNLSHRKLLEGVLGRHQWNFRDWLFSIPGYIYFLIWFIYLLFINRIQGMGKYKHSAMMGKICGFLGKPVWRHYGWNLANIWLKKKSAYNLLWHLYFKKTNIFLQKTWDELMQWGTLPNVGHIQLLLLCFIGGIWVKFSPKCPTLG